MNNETFDQIIKDGLEKLSPALPEQGWDLFQQKLDVPTSTDSTALDQTRLFDQIIAKEISGLNGDNVPKDAWSIFETKMSGGQISESDAATNNPEYLDQIVGDKIKNISTPYSSKYWKPIEVRLDQLLHIQRKYYNIKLVEAALFLLLFVVINQFYPETNILQSNTSQKSLESFPIEEPSFRSGQPIAELQQAEQESIGTNNTVNTDENLQPSTPETANLLDVEVTSSEKSTPYTLSGSQQSIGSKEIPSITEELPTAFEEVQTVEVPSIAKDVEHLLVPIAINRLPFVVNDDPIVPATLEKVPSIQAPVYFDEVLEDEGLYRIMPLALRSSNGIISNEQGKRLVTRGNQDYKPKALLRGSMIGSVDFNRIYTPSNLNERRSESLIRYALGYSTGFTLGFEKGRFEIETGALYSAKYYYPASVLFIEGNFNNYNSAGLKFFELDMLNIPLNFKYNYIYKGKWRAYASVGGSVQFAYQTHYYSASQSDFPSTTNGVGVIGAPAQRGNGNNGSFNRLLEDNKDIFGGWFEGGPFQDNSYISMNLGIGFERYFSTRFSFFAQTMYFHPINLNGILNSSVGPDDEVLSTTSLMTGIRVKITN